jgi:hypothetical protein
MNIKQQFTPKKLLDLKTSLGNGYAKKIQEILIEQYPERKKPYCLPYIYKGLTHEGASEKVIMAALVLKRKRQEMLKELITP